MSELTDGIILGHPLPEIISPVTGEIIDQDSIDQLADAWEDLESYQNRLKIYRIALARAIVKKTSFNRGVETGYVRGEKARIKVKLPADLLAAADPEEPLVQTSCLSGRIPLASTG